MVPYDIVIHMGDGVTLKLPVLFENKHYTEEKHLHGVAEKLAAKLGGELLYVVEDIKLKE